MPTEQPTFGELEGERPREPSPCDGCAVVQTAPGTHGAPPFLFVVHDVDIPETIKVVADEEADPSDEEP